MTLVFSAIHFAQIIECDYFRKHTEFSMFVIMAFKQNFQVVQVVLESYRPQKINTDNNDTEAQGSGWTEEVLKAEGRASSSPSPFTISRIPSWKSIVSDKGEIQLPV